MYVTVSQSLRGLQPFSTHLLLTSTSALMSVAAALHSFVSHCCGCGYVCGM